MSSAAHHKVDSEGVTFEWDAQKAAANLKKHRISFEEGASVFLDPLAITFPDPDHSSEEQREITAGHTIKGRVVLVPIASAVGGSGSLAHVLQPGVSENSMKKKAAAKLGDELRPEYDLSKLHGGVRGKYYRQAVTGTNLVLIEPDLINFFPDSKAVNHALRLLTEVAHLTTTAKRGRTR